MRGSVRRSRTQLCGHIQSSASCFSDTLRHSSTQTSYFTSSELTTTQMSHFTIYGHAPTQTSYSSAFFASPSALGLLGLSDTWSFGWIFDVQRGERGQHSNKIVEFFTVILRGQCCHCWTVRSWILSSSTSSVTGLIRTAVDDSACPSLRVSNQGLSRKSGQLVATFL